MDGGPYSVREIGVGEYAGLQGTVGDCGGLPGRVIALFNYFASGRSMNMFKIIIKEECYPALTNGGVDSYYLPNIA